MLLALFAQAQSSGAMNPRIPRILPIEFAMRFQIHCQIKFIREIKFIPDFLYHQIYAIILSLCTSGIYYNFQSNVGG